MLNLVRKLKRRLSSFVQESEQQAHIPDKLLDWSLHFFPHRFTIEPSIFHRELAEDLDEIATNRAAKICRIAPRGAAKSTMATLADPLRNALEGREMYQIIISDVQTNSNKFLKDIKDEIESNEKLQEAYPDACRVGPVWQQEAIELPNGARIESLGKGAKIRGRRHRQWRPTRITLDDPQSLEDAYSETQMEKDYHWLMSDVMSVGQPDTNFVVLGTALADQCIVCQLEKTPGWQHKRYKQLVEEPAHMHLWQKWRELLWRHDDPERDAKAEAFYVDNPSMNDGGKVLWPERFPLVEVMRKRYSEGERAFQCEQQGIPMPPGDGEFSIDLFDWEGFWVEPQQWPTGNLIEVYALDPSKGKESKQGDFQAFGRIAVDRYMNFWVECWLEKMNTTELSQFVVDLFRNRPAEAIILEGNGFQELLKVPLELAAANAKVENLPLYTVVNTVAKPVRIRRLTVPLSGHRLRFVRSKGTQLCVDQMKKFRNPPIVGQHDDGPDMLEMGLRIANKLLLERGVR